MEPSPVPQFIFLQKKFAKILLLLSKKRYNNAVLLRYSAGVEEAAELMISQGLRSQHFCILVKRKEASYHVQFAEHFGKRSA